MWTPLWDLLEIKGGDLTLAEPAASKEQQGNATVCTSATGALHLLAKPPSFGNAQGFPSFISFPQLPVTHRGAVSGRTV